MSNAIKLNTKLELGLGPMKGSFDMICHVIETSPSLDSALIKSIKHFIWLSRQCSPEEMVFVDHYFERLMALKHYDGTRH